jgi:membrane protease YdiL (CAAX protease family)
VRLITHVPRLALKPEEQLSVQVLRQAFSWFDRAILGIATIALAPVAEEILFRGILYPAIKQAGFKRLALWGTALLFAAIHVNLETFIPLFALAIVLTVLYEKTNNLLAPITAHAAFNALNFASLYMLQEQMGGN